MSLSSSVCSFIKGVACEAPSPPSSAEVRVEKAICELMGGPRTIFEMKSYPSLSEVIDSPLDELTMGDVASAARIFLNKEESLNPEQFDALRQRVTYLPDDWEEKRMFLVFCKSMQHDG